MKTGLRNAFLTAVIALAPAAFAQQNGTTVKWNAIAGVITARSGAERGGEAVGGTAGGCAGVWGAALWAGEARSGAGVSFGADEGGGSEVRLRRELKPTIDDKYVRIPRALLAMAGLEGDVEVRMRHGLVELVEKPDPQIAKNEGMLRRARIGGMSNRGRVLREV